MSKVLCRVIGGGSAAQGTATPDQVLGGIPFSNKYSTSLVGEMTNRGAWIGATTDGGNVMIPEGYHNGQGYVSGAGAYSAGKSAKKSANIQMVITFNRNSNGCNYNGYLYVDGKKVGECANTAAVDIMNQWGPNASASYTITV